MSLIRKDDLVEVITGKYKGERGKVLEVYPKKDRVLVEGINLVVKHERVRMSEKGQEGGIIEKEAPLDVSNVMLVDPKTSKPVRLGVEIGEDGTKRRVTRGRNSSRSALD
ncbi:MAG: large subunit ribosomal protein [Candidatus Sumerlaeota bacterium]|nr:large subunit ribosomal protein [Candidatus Sumerlaeota bacterium]